MRYDARPPFGLTLAAALGLLFLHLPMLLIFLYAFTTEERTYQFPPPGLTLQWFEVTWNRADVWPPLYLSLRVAAVSTLLALVPSVNAVAVMPAYFYDSYAAPRGLVQLPFVDPLPTVSVHIAWRADAPLTAPASHLLDALEQEARAVRSGRRP